jgi:putative endonuclease
MIYVYILESEIGAHHYIGVTTDLKDRLSRHNAGQVSHTSRYAPWKMNCYFAFGDEAKAYAFEKHLKSGSGRAFAKKHF